MTDADALKDIARYLCREAGFDPDEPTRDAYGFDIPNAVIQWTRFRDDARALIAQAQPIETAPKDGTVIRAYAPTKWMEGFAAAGWVRIISDLRVQTVRWQKGDWTPDGWFNRGGEGPFGATMWWPISAEGEHD